MKIPVQLRLRREERWPALVALLVIVALNVLMVYKYYDVFAGNTRGGFWQMFLSKFHVSGFDPILYLVMSVWKVLFSGFRHPLLFWMLYPAAQLNDWLMHLTGINCSLIITAVSLTVADFLSFILFRRILRDVAGVGRGDSNVLCALFFGFAYVMVPLVVPDHYAFSMCILLLTLYVAGLRIRGNRPLNGWLVAVLFLITAGITISNGVKTFLAQWVTNGRKFFAWRNLLFVVAIPSALVLWAGLSVGSVPKHRTEADVENENKMLREKGMPTHTFNEGRPISDVGFLNWTDVTTPRLDATVENLFGESLQLHSDHLLGDIYLGRPVIVRYDWIVNYVVEALLVLMFAAGVWLGRRDRFVWLFMSWFAFDVFLSMVLGFGITEVYIFGPHWLFVMPLAMAGLFCAWRGRRLAVLRVVAVLLALWLWAYNGSLFVSFMLD